MQNRFWYLLSKKLSGHLSDAELTELEELQAAHPDWHYPAQHITNIWGHEKPVSNAEDDFAKHINRMANLGYSTAGFPVEGKMESVLMPEYPISSRSKARWVWMAVAASVVGVISWLFVSQNTARPITSAIQIAKNQVLTGSGKRDKLVLPDGTQVWLNAESKIEYGSDFGKTNRAVTLSGEAYFDVTKNKELPFTIQTDKIHIKVTGTAFNVKAYPKEKVSETSIIRGRVEVTVNARPKELYVLKPNEKLIIRDEAETAPVQQAAGIAAPQKEESKPLIQLGYINYIDNDADSATLETSWIFNRLVFDNESFAEMAVKMERWYGVKITVEDPKVAAIRLNYQIQNETIEKALANMQYVARFHFTVSGKNITITK